MTYLTSRSSGIFFVSLLFLFLLLLDETPGQDLIKPKLISPNNLSSYLSISGKESKVDHLKVIGVMVEFKADTNRFTSGNGTFGPGSIPYLDNPGTNIDPLPHNQSYFEAHLEFSKNYFETVSDEHFSLDFQVLPEVFTLSQPMATYSPTGQNPDLSTMAKFVHDVWTLVGQSGEISTAFDENDNIAFVIFHAGVGRDIELIGTNLNKTPQDLPSFYLSKKTLSDFLDDPSFSGFPIDNGNLIVDNSLIIPRTLTRAGEDAVGNQFILPLSINGLLTAQIGSHLGLPDLFNTETGQAGIGRFGLMDGAGIFSYNGLFPPELSAWEKKFLGWTSPFQVDYNSQTSISLPAASLHEDKSVAQISISNDEYFLVENRHRDLQGDGITITIKKNDGTYAEQSFSNLDTEFIYQESGFDDLLESGVVVKVSNYDFSLPGGPLPNSDSSGDDEIRNGGMLIWHIDEALIEDKIDQVGVNNNPNRRGVDLEEADGAQDIGQPTTIGISQNQVNGSAFDFWWSENTARVITQTDSIQFYENRFGPDTTPNNHSNSGSPSNFELYDFSDNLPISSFKIRPVNPNSELYELWDSRSGIDIKASSGPKDQYWNRYPLAAQTIIINNEQWILLPGYDGIQFYHPENKHLTGRLISLQSLQQPYIDQEQSFFTIAANPRSEVDPFQVSTYQFDGESINEIESYSIPANSAFISSYQNNILDIDGTTTQVDVTDGELIQNENNIQFSDNKAGYQSKIENGSLILNFPGGSESFLINKQNDNERIYTGIIQNQDSQFLFYLLEEEKISLYLPADGYQSQKIIHSSDFIDWPAFVDFNRDNNPDVLLVDQTSNQLIAKNINGAFLSSFPISAPTGVKFIGTPLVADINGDNQNEAIITGYDNYSMNLYSFNESGEPLDGFPLYVGGIDNPLSQPVHPLLFEDKLISLSHSGDLKIWQFKQIQNVQWRSKYGNQTTNKISGFIDFDGSPDPQFSLLNSEETYNWPNPAKNETQLRYQTSEAAEIHVKILTMSGRVIADHTFQSRGGPPEELLIDTSDWASGAYLALVEAKNGNITERKLIKIAIAK